MPKLPSLYFVIALIFSSILFLIPHPVQAQTSPQTYYLDCQIGNDSQDGQTQQTAWRTMTKANAAALAPGDKLLLKRGCTWLGPLKASWTGTADSPITIGAYGSGEKPHIQHNANGTDSSQVNVEVTGSYQIIEHLRTSIINPARSANCLLPDGTGVPYGWYVGFNVTNGTHNTIQHVEIFNLALGIHTTDATSHIKVLNSHIHDLNMLWILESGPGGVDQAMGALGILFRGDDQEAGYNLFERNEARCTRTTDNSVRHYSAAFEIYNTNRTYVHHNKAFGHRKHFEMGHDTGKTTNDNILAYNLFISDHPDAKGPTIHGPNNHFGPVLRTQIYNNTMVFTGVNSEALICNCDPDTIVKNNIFIAELKAAFIAGPIQESNNIYWDYKITNPNGPLVQFGQNYPEGTISSTSLKADPLLLNSSVPGGDYRLTFQSPAKDKGVPILNQAASFYKDMNSISIPQGQYPDVGTYEITQIPSVTPTPSIISISNLTYHVDCNTGNNANNGLTPQSAWSTVAKANQANLLPGDQLLFKRGCTWTTTSNGIFLEAKWQGTAEHPIIIGAYGAGEKPILKVNAQGQSGNHDNIRITGSHQIIENLRLTLENPYRNTACIHNGQGIPYGYNTGINIFGSHNLVQNFEIDHLTIGIAFKDESTHNKILHGHIHHLNGLWSLSQKIGALGALGVNLHGDNNEVGYLLFENNQAECTIQNPNPDEPLGDGVTPNLGIYQHYSAPFEVYNANNSYVHHNKAFGHRKHFEMGHNVDNPDTPENEAKTTNNNILAYNLFVSDEPFAVGPNVHGYSNLSYGPVLDTFIYNNTIVFTGPNSQGISCNCTGGATVKNNIFIAESKAAFYRGEGALIESHNLYWDFNTIIDTTADPFVQFADGSISQHSIISNPLFLDGPSGNFRISASSLAVNKADNTVTHTINLDLADIPIPQGNLDIGAYEFQADSTYDLNQDTHINVIDLVYGLNPLRGYNISFILEIITHIFTF